MERLAWQRGGGGKEGIPLLVEKKRKGFPPPRREKTVELFSERKRGAPENPRFSSSEQKEKQSDARNSRGKRIRTKLQADYYGKISIRHREKKEKETGFGERKAKNIHVFSGGSSGETRFFGRRRRSWEKKGAMRRGKERDRQKTLRLQRSGKEDGEDGERGVTRRCYGAGFDKNKTSSNGRGKKGRGSLREPIGGGFKWNRNRQKDVLLLLTKRARPRHQRKMNKAVRGRKSAGKSIHRDFICWKAENYLEPKRKGTAQTKEEETEKDSSGVL